MYTLTITVLSLVLVVAMATSTLFHGGAATYSDAKAQAIAVGLVNEGVQIQAGYQMNLALGSWEHLTLPQLVSKGYLKSLPPYGDVDWGWATYAAGIRSGFAGPVLVSRVLPGMTTGDGGLKVCNALEVMAGRPAKTNLLEFQTPMEGELPGRFGCMQDDVLSVYFKL